MPKLPRDLTGDKLAKLLRRYGYQVTRQAGSHLQVTTQQGGKHHITIPKHNPLKVGTLGAILDDVAKHVGKSKNELLQELFGEPSLPRHGPPEIARASAFEYIPAHGQPFVKRDRERIS